MGVPKRDRTLLGHGTGVPESPDGPASRVPKVSCPSLGHSVFVRYTLRSLAANRVRTAVTVVGIALATGLLMAVLASVTSLQEGLANQSRETGGVWQVGLWETDDAELERLREVAGARLDRLATRRDLGAAPFSAADAEHCGTYLSVLTLPQEQDGTARSRGDLAYEVIPSPALDSGRLPEKDGEIALTSNLRGVELTPGASELPGVDAGVAAEGPLAVGSEVTLVLGRRVARYEDGAAQEVGAENSVMYQSVIVGTDPYGSPNVEQGPIAETLEGASEPRTYTVVGFVDPDWEIPGHTAYVSAEAAGGATIPRETAYFSTSCASYEELEGLVETLRPADDDRPTALNTGLLTYEGLTPDRLIFDTLGIFAATLATVVVAAAVSLITNAFTISVSERTRQFGLLSSLGASRRQLRHAVLVEAAVVGAAGIPLGVLLGLAGAAAAFAVTGTGWARMVGTASAVTLSVRPWCVGLTVLLAVLALLVSAMVPAVRAGRVSAVDAIRQAADVRPNRRLRRALRRRRSALDDLSPDRRRPRGLAARLGGMPAFLARRTLLVSAGKARVAVLSLAVSVTLLVTAGVVNDMLSGAVGVAYGEGAFAYDLELTVADESGPDAAGEKDARSAALDTADGMLGRIAAIEGVSTAAYDVQAQATVRLSEALVPVTPEGVVPGSSGGVNASADGTASASIYLVDDTSWRALADAGVVAAENADPARLSALLVSTVSATDGMRYGERELLAPGTSGAVELLALDAREGYGDPLIAWGDGEPAAYYVPEGASDLSGQVEVPVGEATHVAASLPVTVASPDDLGEHVSVSAAQLKGDFPALVMPARAVRESPGALEALLDGSRTPWACHHVRLAAGADDAEVLRQMQDAASGLPGVESLGTSNLIAQQRDARAMSFTVQVFLVCFAAILALIAVANVFNTIASGMMLRTREFAALRSAGMGERAFRRMILAECADYALRGLALGTALALVVELALWRAMSLSVSGLAFVVPWSHLALAFAVVVAVLAASVAYALRKTHALDLVEALRSEAL